MHARTLIIAIVVVLALLAASYMFFIAPQSLMAPTAQVPVDPEGWVRMENEQGLSFAYPEELALSYVSVSQWPPEVRVSADMYECASGTPGPGASVEEKTIAGRTYCVHTTGEGAAGSTYVTYEYSSAGTSGTIRTTFTLRFPQCLNYDDPDRSACQAEQLAFEPDALAADIIESVQIP